jgi:hypothetical protein
LIFVKIQLATGNADSFKKICLTLITIIDRTTQGLGIVEGWGKKIVK